MVAVPAGPRSLCAHAERSPRGVGPVRLSRRRRSAVVGEVVGPGVSAVGYPRGEDRVHEACHRGAGIAFGRPCVNETRTSGSTGTITPVRLPCSSEGMSMIQLSRAVRSSGGRQGRRPAMRSVGAPSLSRPRLAASTIPRWGRGCPRCPAHDGRAVRLRSAKLTACTVVDVRLLAQGEVCFGGPEQCLSMCVRRGGDAGEVRLCISPGAALSVERRALRWSRIRVLTPPSRCSQRRMRSGTPSVSARPEERQ
jgi:hypothetical protein